MSDSRSLSSTGIHTVPVVSATVNTPAFTTEDMETEAAGEVQTSRAAPNACKQTPRSSTLGFHMHLAFYLLYRYGRKGYLPLTRRSSTPFQVATLMQSARRGERHAPRTASVVTRFRRDRSGLGIYLENPSSPALARNVIFHTTDFVAIRDLFPKATVHALLIPRDNCRALQHPFDAFDDADFLAATRYEAARLRVMAADELRRGVGGPVPEDSADLVIRDWEAEVRVGVHARPSMQHLHVHVVSHDLHSPTLRHRKHYNSFATPFFVDLAEFPLARDDTRRDSGQGYLQRPLICWRCGENFGTQFTALKKHLGAEFEAWRMQ